MNVAAAGKLNGKVVVDMSSISPLETGSRSASTSWAPSTGRAGFRRRSGRQTGHADYHGGRRGSDLRTGAPLLALMGKNITLIGGNGDGQTCKVANQIIVALTIEAVSEALVFASRAGADPAGCAKP